MLFLGCSERDDATSINYEVIPVSDVEIDVEEFRLDETYDIGVRYELPADCYRFNGFDVTNSDRQSIISVVAVRSNNSSCTPQSGFEEQRFFEFVPRQLGDYTFRFFDGLDNQGNTSYIELVIPVVE